MKELVLFYSYSGNTRKIAEKYAQENNFDIYEVIAVKKPNKLRDYTAGIIKCMTNGVCKIKPLDVNFADYDIINIFAPVWAGVFAPAMNSALKLIPPGKIIKLFMVSMSGASSKDIVSKRVQKLGLEVAGYEDIKS